MANKTLFQTIFGGMIPATDAVNFEGAPAYALSPKQALAQYRGTASGNRAGKSPSHALVVPVARQYQKPIAKPTEPG